MSLPAKQKKTLRTIGHDLHPIVTVAGKGLSEAVHEELERAITDHELIKVKLGIDDRELRKTTVDKLCREHGAELVQVIGKVALVFRANPAADPRKSNLQKLKSGRP